MKGLLLRCRDADMMGPFCDYVSEPETFDDAIRELRVHANVHNERGITDDEVTLLKNIVKREAA